MCEKNQATESLGRTNVPFSVSPCRSIETSRLIPSCSDVRPGICSLFLLQTLTNSGGQPQEHIPHCWNCRSDAVDTSQALSLHRRDRVMCRQRVFLGHGIGPRMQQERIAAVPPVRANLLKLSKQCCKVKWRRCRPANIPSSESEERYLWCSPEKSCKLAFVLQVMSRAEQPTSSAPRPLSITAVGLYMLFGACLMPINIWTHAPAFLLGADFRDWPAVLFFLAIGTLDTGIGIGLLRFAPWSRMAAIYFFLFRILNTAITFLLPGSRARFEDGVAAVEASLGRRALLIRRCGLARCWSLA